MICFNAGLRIEHHPEKGILDIMEITLKEN